MTHLELTKKYIEINDRHSIPIPQHDIRDEHMCVCVWADVNNNHNSISTISKPSFVGESDVWYDTSNDPRNGVLHFTLFQFQTIGNIPNEIAVKSNGGLIRDIITNFPRLRITFKGLAKVKHGIIICGYPSFDLSTIRNEFRTHIQGVIEPHPQDICHMTLVRFGDSVDGRLADLNRFIDEYKDFYFGELVIDSWKYGYGTWMQRVTTIVESIHSPLWILHRGLKYGPDKERENDINNILMELNDGWAVEIDLWKFDDEIKIGHDKEILLTLSLTEFDSLVKFKDVFVHCKNLEMLEYMIMKNVSCDYFVHDVDVATITGKGLIWCYPGYRCNNCIVVLPETVDINMAFEKTNHGVCSDFIPSELKKRLRI